MAAEWIMMLARSRLFCSYFIHSLTGRNTKKATVK